MTIRERIRAAFVPELKAAYIIRNNARDMRDHAMKLYEECAEDLRQAQEESKFWHIECDRADRKYIILMKMVNEAQDIDELRRKIAEQNGEDSA